MDGLIDGWIDRWTDGCIDDDFILEELAYQIQKYIFFVNIYTALPCGEDQEEITVV